jgi:sugar phosphate permease
MKHIFSRTTLILIAFLSIERFTFYSIKGYLPIYLSREFDFIFSEMKVLSGYLSYIPLLSYLIIGLTFDKLKKFSELRFYFLPIIVSLLLMFIKTPATFIIGYSILFFTGPFIKINVIIKIFDYLKSISKDDDRVFIFKFLVLNIFSALVQIPVKVIT